MIGFGSASYHSPGLWSLAWRRLLADRVAMVSLAVVLLFFAMMGLSMAGLIADDWAEEVAVNYAPPSFLSVPDKPEKATPPAVARPVMSSTPRALPPDNPVDPLRDVIRKLRAQMAVEKAAAESRPDDYGIADPLEAALRDIYKQQSRLFEPADPKQPTRPFGADKWGHDILKKTIKGAETSILVGLAAALMATVLGTLFGAAAGYFGRRVDDFFNWFYNVFTSIPYLLLILAVAAVLQQKGVGTIILILGLTGWTGVFRLVRAEYMKHKEREYVIAADAIGSSHVGRMLRHIFPNISHVPLVQMSILAVGFIKSEVILSFLGFGVPVGVVSWGSMLNEAQNELILGKWWQLVAATVAMAILVTAFSLFTDALRDALDPKLK